MNALAIAENWHNQTLERHLRSVKTCDCCNGSGKEYYSSCCGADIDKGICSDCGGACRTEHDDCETCKGEGIL